MDFSEAATDQATGAGTYTQLPTSQLPEHLYIVHCTDSASESGKVRAHSLQPLLQTHGCNALAQSHAGGPAGASHGTTKLSDLSGPSV